MLRAIHGLLVAASALTLATSCKPRERTTDAEVKNITIAEAFGFKDYGGLTVYLPGESITVCLQGISTTSQYAALIKDGIMRWVDAVRDRIPEVRLKEIKFTQVDTAGRCTGSHLKVVYNPQVTRAYAEVRPTLIPVIHMGVTQGNAINTLTHEIGHAFGLGDTYVEGVWTCRAGQPMSLMCSIGYDRPQEDDIRGIERLFRQFHPKKSGGYETNLNVAAVDNPSRRPSGPTSVTANPAGGLRADPARSCYCQRGTYTQSGYRYEVCGVMRAGQWVDNSFMQRGVFACDSNFCATYIAGTVRTQCDNLVWDASDIQAASGMRLADDTSRIDPKLGYDPEEVPSNFIKLGQRDKGLASPETGKLCRCGLDESKKHCGVFAAEADGGEALILLDDSIKPELCGYHLCANHADTKDIIDGACGGQFFAGPAEGYL